MMMTAFLPLLLAAAAPPAGASARTICANGTGVQDGFFYSFYRDTGSGCMTLGPRGRYDTQWALGKAGNLVVGKGWPTGSTTRTIRYRAASFDPGANGYLALYGWSTAPLVEYYVVDNWGGFTPPGADAVSLGTLRSDGGIYRIYRTRRTDQPSIVGTASFDQYWSVRTTRRALGATNRISFANHVRAWRGHGMPLGSMGYQVVATEGFGSTGRATVMVGR